MEPSSKSTKEVGMRHALAVILAGVIALVVLVLLVRVFIRPIPPGQQAPSGHFGEPCWACHLVTNSAEPAEVQ